MNRSKDRKEEKREAGCVQREHQQGKEKVTGHRTTKGKQERKRREKEEK